MTVIVTLTEQQAETVIAAMEQEDGVGCDDPPAGFNAAPRPPFQEA